MTRSTTEYLQDAQRALRAEIAAQKEKGAPAIPIEDGLRVAEEPLGATYRFTLPYEVILPEGMPLELQVGPGRWPAELLFRDGLLILLLVERNDAGLPEPQVARAGLVAQPWFLTAELLDRVAELESKGLGTGPAQTLVGRMFGEGIASVHPPAATAGGLNGEQVAAVRACTAEDLWFVWGPPGTGKTSTLGHVVRALVDRGESVLVTAHSNVAVDAALVSSMAQLEASSVGRELVARRRVVRAGPAATAEAAATGVASRDLALAASPELTSRRRDLERSLRRVASGAEAGDVQALRTALKELRIELNEAERQIIAEGDVVFATLSKVVLAAHIHGRRFAGVIVDEVSMTSPPQVVVASSLAQRRSLVFGDFRQLPPIVVADSSYAQEMLGTDVFAACHVDRVAHLDQAPGVSMLREQYRMAPDIRSLTSSFAYAGKLRDGAGVAERTQPLADIDPMPGAATVWRNAARYGGRAWSDAARSSRFNPTSALHAVRDALHLAADGRSVVLLAPYRPQVRLMTALLREAQATAEVSLGTVHRFQGAEGDAVVLDLVDAPPLPIPGRPLRGDGGKRLLTVGVSRARGKLVVHGHARLTHEEAHFGDQAALLRRLAQREAPAEDDWEITVGDLAMQHTPKLPAGLTLLPEKAVTMAWLPPNPPEALARLASPVLADAPDGNAVVIADDRTWVCARRPGGDWEAILVVSPRFANAFAEVAGGGSLTSVRTTADRAGSVVARFDACARCGDEAALVLGGSFYVKLGCGSCGDERWPTTVELESWAWATGFTCPKCNGAVRAKRGKTRPFLSCAAYPKCDGSAFVSELVGRPVVDLGRRPIRPVAQTKKRQAAPVGVGRSKSGHKIADLAEFDDYGIERAEAEAWLDLGLNAEQAAPFVGRGVTPEAYAAQRQAGG